MASIYAVFSTNNPACVTGCLGGNNANRDNTFLCRLKCNCCQFSLPTSSECLQIITNIHYLQKIIDFILTVDILHISIEYCRSHDFLRQTFAVNDQIFCSTSFRSMSYGSVTQMMWRISYVQRKSIASEVK